MATACSSTAALTSTGVPAGVCIAVLRSRSTSACSISRESARTSGNPGGSVTDTTRLASLSPTRHSEALTWS
jgi:hypothetical protein